ncbi:MAG: hypothetical protein IJ268_13900, partial [Proteobacteria bacterium]|nr:hypothetical protein [Pseudomonadota bacterium]
MRIPITGTQIVSGVCRALANTFDIPIYREPIDQDFEEPCFFVWEQSTDTSPVIWPKYRETHNIEVRYFPPNRQSQHSEARDIGAQLVEVLKRITIRNGEDESLPIFATDSSRRIVDDSLSFSVTYKTEGYFYEQRANSMEEI